MAIFKSKEEKEQIKAEALGFSEKSERRVEDKGKPKPPEVKTEHICVVDGCNNDKAPGQTHVCTAHVRAG